MNEENGRKRRTEETAKVWEQVEEISEDEVLTALKKMQGEKAVGPDNLPAEVWKCLGELGLKYLTRMSNQLLKGKRMPEEWRKSVPCSHLQEQG